MKTSFRFLLPVFLIVILLCSQRVNAANSHAVQDGCNIYPDYGLAVSPDGKFVVANWYTKVLTSNADKQYFTLWEIETEKGVATFELSPGFRGLAFSPNSRLVALADPDKVIVWDIFQRKVISTAEYNELLAGVTFTPDSELLLMYGTTGGHLWDIKTGKLVYTIPAVIESDNTFFSPDGNRLLTDGRLLDAPTDAAAISIWDVKTGKKSHIIDGVWSGLFSPNNKYIFTEGVLGLELRNAQTYELIHRFNEAENDLDSNMSRPFTFSADRAYLKIK